VAASIEFNVYTLINLLSGDAMKTKLLVNFKIVLFGVLTFLSVHGVASGTCEQQTNFSVIIHGGAGNWQIPASRMQVYREFMTSILMTAQQRLRHGDTALEVVEGLIVKMEDSPLFNAGKGSIRNSDGEFELDASIMDGKDRSAGAVSAVKYLKNPISAARLVMERSPHVLMTSSGGDRFAADNGATVVGQDYFDTEVLELESHKFGTVGAVALDRCGDIAAGTSTGGYRGKLPGRVGDSPIIGAGTYANPLVGVSATGHGEYFIRFSVTHDIAAVFEYKQLNLEDTLYHVIHEKLKPNGGNGGVIAIDHQGNIKASYNTRAMLRAWTDQGLGIDVRFQ
jgi:L-asparaginase / beta-aspartyl-peptidase